MHRGAGGCHEGLLSVAWTAAGIAALLWVAPAIARLEDRTRRLAAEKAALERVLDGVRGTVEGGRARTGGDLARALTAAGLPSRVDERRAGRILLRSGEGEEAGDFVLSLSAWGGDRLRIRLAALSADPACIPLSLSLPARLHAPARDQRLSRSKGSR
jgi:hypothetical protein